MLRIMSDNDVLGHVSRLVKACQAPPWDEFWRDLGCIVYTFDDFGLAADASDATIWEACQANGVLLITGNRSGGGPESLEATIRRSNRANCLPVLTLADADRVSNDPEYAQATARRLIEILLV